MNTQLLENLGFTKGEIKVYLALLELGPSTTTPIIEKAVISSSKVYEILERLKDKGMVSFIKKEKKNIYEAANPERIKDYIYEKKATLTQQEKEFENFLPELLLKQKLSEVKQDAAIFRGVNGLKAAFDPQLQKMKKGDEYLALGVPKISPIVNRYFIHFYNKRIEKGVIAKTIFTEEGRERAKTRPKKNCEYRFLPKEYQIDTTINVFKDEVILAIFDKPEPLAIKVVNQSLADTLKIYFNLMWRIAKP